MQNSTMSHNEQKTSRVSVKMCMQFKLYLISSKLNDRENKKWVIVATNTVIFTELMDTV